MKLARVATITKVLLEEGLGWLTESPTEKPDEPARSDADTAVRLRRTLERLGPSCPTLAKPFSLDEVERVLLGTWKAGEPAPKRPRSRAT